mgnify:FL=1
MLKFRRHIAIFVLALFTCQSVMAGLGEHLAFSGDQAMESQHQSFVGHFTNGEAKHAERGLPGLVDTDCCHAHGHCHTLAFVGVVALGPEYHGANFTALYSDSYHFLYYDPLLRPPDSA